MDLYTLIHILCIFLTKLLEIKLFDEIFFYRSLILVSVVSVLTRWSYFVLYKFVFAMYKGCSTSFIYKNAFSVDVLFNPLSFFYFYDDILLIFYFFFCLCKNSILNLCVLLKFNLWNNCLHPNSVSHWFYVIVKAEPPMYIIHRWIWILFSVKYQLRQIVVSLFFIREIISFINYLN